MKQWTSLAGFLARAVIVGLALAAVAMLVSRQLEPAPGATDTADSGSPPVVTSFADAVERAAPAVVNIYVDRIVLNQTIFRDPQFEQFTGRTLVSKPRLVNRRKLGSGVILRSDGIIVTNFHVINQASNINVALWDGRVTGAVVLGADEETDLAVLKVDYDDLPTLESAAGTLRVGDVVLAIGNPLGLGKTVTMGIVSATGRSDLNVSIYETLIQTDAAINSGNSGGALVDPGGRLVGINTASVGQGANRSNVEGIGFAIPIQTATEVATAILLQGEVVRGWLGTEFSDGTPRMREMSDGETGVAVLRVYPGSPGAEAGLQPGDYVTRLGNNPISDLISSYRVIADTAPGSNLDIEYWRGNRRYATSATLIKRPQRLQGASG